MSTIEQILNEFYISIYLSSFILFASFLFFFGIYKINKTKKYFPYILFVVIGAILSFLYFKNFDKPNGDDENRYNKKNALMIDFKNQNPCFYFDENNKIIENGYIDYVKITAFDINGTIPQNEQLVWGVYDENHTISKEKKLSIKSILGRKNCLEYGDKRVHSTKPKDFKKNNIYTVKIYVKSYADSSIKNIYITQFPYEYTLKGKKDGNR